MIEGHFNHLSAKEQQFLAFPFTIGDIKEAVSVFNESLVLTNNECVVLGDLLNVVLVKSYSAHNADILIL